MEAGDEFWKSTCKVDTSEKVRCLRGIMGLETEVRGKEIWVLAHVGEQGPDLGEALNAWTSAWRPSNNGWLYNRVWPHPILMLGEELREAL